MVLEVVLQLLLLQLLLLQLLLLQLRVLLKLPSPLGGGFYFPSAVLGRQLQTAWFSSHWTLQPPDVDPWKLPNRTSF